MMPSTNPLQQVFDAAKHEFVAALLSRTPFQDLLSTATPIDEVYDAAEKYQREQSRTAGKLRNLQRIRPLLNRLNEYAGAIEVFVQVKPDILALLWGSIKLILQWTSGWNQGLDAMVKTIERIGELLPSFSDLVVHFIDVEHIKDILGLFYRNILDFYLVMVQFFSLPRTLPSSIRVFSKIYLAPHATYHGPTDKSCHFKSGRFYLRRCGQSIEKRSRLSKDVSRSTPDCWGTILPTSTSRESTKPARKSLSALVTGS